MMKIFNPTHLLVSRSRQIPVQLIPGPSAYGLQTEQEWESGKPSAFELRSRLGIFCQGISVVGYQLKPIAVVVDAAPSEQSGAKA
jgi:hypothetical protein